jgi:integrase
MAKKFYLYERKRAGKFSVWYVRYRQADGTIGSPISTKETDEDKANDWAIEHLSGEQSRKARKPRVLTFKEWAAPWWKFDTCPYLREKIGNGFHISPEYADVRRSYLDRHLVPEFGKVPLSQLTPVMFRDYKNKLQREGQLRPATINRILGTVRVMFNYAVEMQEMQYNPVGPVKELKENPKVRGILTKGELDLLFSPDAYETAWHRDPKHYTINLLAATCGLRLGECQALQMKNVHPDGVEVRHSWNDRYGMGPAKQGSERIVTVPSFTSKALAALVALNRWGDPQPTDIVFWGQDRNTPMTKTAILKQFKAALARIGIEEKERSERNILFHGHRHYFNTFVRGKVPDEQLRRVTGHKSEAMTINYDHAAIEHLADVKAVQEKMLGLDLTRQEVSNRSKSL